MAQALVKDWFLEAHSRIYIFHFDHSEEFAYTFDIQTKQIGRASVSSGFARIGLVRPPETEEDEFAHRLTYWFLVENSGNTSGSFTIWVKVEKKS